LVVVSLPAAVDASVSLFIHFSIEKTNTDGW
jgi:hypothetical protein